MNVHGLKQGNPKSRSFVLEMIAERARPKFRMFPSPAKSHRIRRQICARYQLLLVGFRKDSCESWLSKTTRNTGNEDHAILSGVSEQENVLANWNMRCMWSSIAQAASTQQEGRTWIFVVHLLPHCSQVLHHMPLYYTPSLTSYMAPMQVTVWCLIVASSKPTAIAVLRRLSCSTTGHVVGNRLQERCV